VMHLLKMPTVLSGLRFDGQHGDREEVIAFANAAVEIGSGISGCEVNQTKLRIDGRCLPDRGATVLPRIVVLRPGFVSDLARAGNRVEGPHQIPALRVERFHAPARSVLTT